MVPAIYPNNDKPEKLVIKGTGHSSSPGERVNNPTFGAGLHAREHILLARQVGIPSSSASGRIPSRLRHRERSFIPEIGDEVLASKKLFVGGLSWYSPGPNRPRRGYPMYGVMKSRSAGATGSFCFRKRPGRTIYVVYPGAVPAAGEENDYLVFTVWD